MTFGRFEQPSYRLDPGRTIPPPFRPISKLFRYPLPAIGDGDPSGQGMKSTSQPHNPRSCSIPSDHIEVERRVSEESVMSAPHDRAFPWRLLRRIILEREDISYGCLEPTK